MGEQSSIEWTNHTFNPWIGCEKVSAGCKNCYASVDTYARVSASRGLPLWGPGSSRHRTSEANWRLPLRWNRKARTERLAFESSVAGDYGGPPWERPRVFCASLADVFEARADLDPWRADLFDLIEKCNELDWLLLTKRPENVLGMAPSIWGNGHDGERMRSLWPSHVWLGATIENQEQADKRIPHLLAVPAPVRFLSLEPLLGPVNLARGYDIGDGLAGYPLEVNDTLGGQRRWPIDWVIVGGESGHGARPMHPDWVRSIRDQCVSTGVPFFFKQWGEYQYESEHGADVDWSSFVDAAGRVHGLREMTPSSRGVRRVGKKNSGRVLGGRTWDEMPKVAT